MTPPVTPLLTVDIVIRLHNHSVVLIERRHPPFGWALPGGFVDVGETLEQAAIREANEETGLAVTLEILLGCYSDPKRDPRGHTVSVVYVAKAQGEPRAADDAKNLSVVDPADHGKPLVFDHGLILNDYLRYTKGGKSAPLRV